MLTAFTKTRVIICTVLLWLGTGLFAQQKDAPYESISTAQGLSQGMVLDMLQDKEGFIWVATKEGLNRYDGYNFKVFTNDPYNPNSLSSNIIRSLFEDSKGRIWVVTLDAGLNVYDKKTGIFRRITHRPNDPTSLSGNRIRSSIVELPDGQVLVAPENSALNRISLPDKFFEKDLLPIITHVAIPGQGKAFGTGKDDKGKIWVGCMDKKIYCFDPVGNHFELLCDGTTFTPAIANMGQVMWAGRDVVTNDNDTVFRPCDTTGRIVDGVFRENETGKISLGQMGIMPVGSFKSYFYDIRKWTSGSLLKDAQIIFFNSALINVQGIMIDRSGMIWLGTNGFGLHKYNIAAGRFHHLFPDFSVRYVLPLSDNGFFLGGWSNDKWVNKDELLIPNPIKNTLITNDFDNFLVSRSGDYWIWKDSKTLLKYHPATKAFTTFAIANVRERDDKQPMLEDQQGNIWICGLGGSIARVNPATALVTSFNMSTKSTISDVVCTAFYQDSRGVFWMGTEEGFAKIIFDDKTDKPIINWYKNSTTDRNSLNYNYVSCFLDDPADNNYLWICTKGGGLNRLDKTNSKFLHLTTKDGLPNNVVYGILPDESKNIWGSTNKGIFCLMPGKTTDDTTWVIRNFTKADGLQGDEFNSNAFARLANGKLVFGGVNGLNIFEPKQILTAGFTPNVFVTNILVNNSPVTARDKSGVLQKNIEETSQITLNYLQDILTLEFASLDFTAPNQNKYRYQLVGIDKEWVESGTRRTATYLHLPSGTYTFKVQGSNSQGIWSDKVAELQVIVLPPWWRTWWAYLIYLSLAGLAIVAYFRFTVNRAKLRQQLQFEQREAARVKELDTLKTQLYTNITHEFRTPLTVILGMAQQVKTKPEEHLENGMEMIVRNGESLLKLVNEMLDLSKLESGKMSLQLVQGDVITFMRYIVESFHSLAESQQKHLHYLSDLDTLQITYDPEKIRQIVSNLLSNALKFTPPKGNIYISVSEGKASEESEKITLVIKVKDTGKGIPEDMMEHIFERFYQVDTSTTRSSEGTGIGLALTRELVKLMGGEISVKSPPTGAQRGTEFTVWLPMKRAGITIAERPIITSYNNHLLTAISIKNGEVYESNISQKSLILLVEDNADVVAYTASCLPDYRLAVGKDGLEGFDIATDMVPDLIITDVMMPFVDGFELCRKLKADERTSHIPIIMLTAKAGIKSKIEGLEHGADAYLEKPFNKEELLIRIKKLLELRVLLQQFYLKKAGIAEAAPADVPAIANTPVAEPKKTENAFVIKVREAIEAHLSNEHFTVEHLCKLVFLSHSQLHRKLEALTGYSPNRFIRLIRLTKAKEMLLHPETSISTIALECGYNDAGYFGRVFKQEMGVTPNEWRGKMSVAE